MTPEVNFAKEPLHSLIANKVPEALFIGARVSLPKDCKGNGFCTGCKDLLGPDIAFFLTGHIQKESIRVTAGFKNIKLTDDLSFSKVQLYVEVCNVLRKRPYDFTNGMLYVFLNISYLKII